MAKAIKSKRPSSKRNGATPLVGKAKGMVTDWLNKHGAGDWLTAATRQRGVLMREVRQLSEEIIEKIANAPFFAHREQLIRDARHHLESVVDQIGHSSLISRAMDTARLTRTEILSFLNVPTQQELKKLQLRLNKIESRIAVERTKRPRADIPTAGLEA